ncbi:unnamed protein product [Microthlaspi erraticum]|uniref:Uncharacterized protein n=1 Tax=Microthlaspi erraticum TaxID=1685480 RepID=A0A6D2JAD3_9BRAS|nr:unnamed protein product [Microthlaspi erraticum]
MLNLAIKLSDRSSPISSSLRNFLFFSSSPPIRFPFITLLLSLFSSTIAIVAPSNDKPFGISQIKAYIPITLDMTKLNYQAWRELFETHCSSFSVLGHIDGTSISTPATEKEWKELDGLVMIGFVCGCEKI